MAAHNEPSHRITNQDGPMVCPRGLEVYPPGHVHCPSHNVQLVRQTNDPMVGRSVGKWDITESINWGGWASIYQATHRNDKSIAAVKIMHSHLAQSPESIKRFLREARSIDRVSHPCIAKVFEAGILDEGQPYLVMELVNGITLADRLATLGPLTAEQAVPLFLDICEALGAAHDKGIIHRDIKPSNVMIAQTPKGELSVKLVDFGLARAMENSGIEQEQITHTGQTLGSPAYMSPEQCLGYTLDARSDIYSLGCTMYETVSGKPPFVAESIMKYMEKHTSQTPPALEIKSRESNFGYNVAHVIMQMLSKVAGDRQSSMMQVREQLQACLWKSEPTPPPLPILPVQEPPTQTVTVQPPMSSERIKRLAGTIAPVLLLIAIAISFVVIIRHAPKVDEPKAQVPSTSSNATEVPTKKAGTKDKKRNAQTKPRK